ncbi:MAG: hypothetical protein FJ265_15910 [Planctomycetes bacterium]|nr:hypothetical protein [Planctomycetota bacterium]
MAGLGQFPGDEAALELLLRQRFVVLADEGPRRAGLRQFFAACIEPRRPGRAGRGAAEGAGTPLAAPIPRR